MDYRQLLPKIYELLFTRFGHQHWWPGQTTDEIIIGAVLTQSVSWKNVVKAIAALKAADLLSLPAIAVADPEVVAPLIRPTLYYKQKALKLQAVADWFGKNCHFEYPRLYEHNLVELRQALLRVRGVGPETADSILLYALARPVFVVDAYTRRLWQRLGLGPESIGYEELRAVFEGALPQKVDLFNDYHAQIVRLGHEHCAKKPRCSGCPLLTLCPCGQS